MKNLKNLKRLIFLFLVIVIDVMVLDLMGGALSFKRILISKDSPKSGGSRMYVRDGGRFVRINKVLRLGEEITVLEVIRSKVGFDFARFKYHGRYYYIPCEFLSVETKQRFDKDNNIPSTFIFNNPKKLILIFLILNSPFFILNSPFITDIRSILYFYPLPLLLLQETGFLNNKMI